MQQQPVWIEGVSDATGFLGSALLGLDTFSEGYGNSAVGGILLVALGGGLGPQLARRWPRSKAAAKIGTP